MARDRHRQRRRLDLQPAVRHFERHRVVRVLRAESTRRQPHRIRLIRVAAAVHVRALRNRFRLRRAMDLFLRQRRALGNADLVSRYALLAARVCLRIIVARDRHRHVNRVDLLVTVRNAECNIEIRIVVRKLGSCQAHIRRANVCPGCFRCTTESEIRRRVQRVADCYIITGHRMLIAIIIYNTLLSFYCYCYRPWLNCKSSGFIGHQIVTLYCITARRNGVFTDILAG